jgi:hypothetical protein
MTMAPSPEDGTPVMNGEYVQFPILFTTILNVISIPELVTSLIGCFVMPNWKTQTTTISVA